MVNCTYTDVKRIISTSLADADITALIVLADAEITARGLDTRGSDLKKTVSMYLTADMIQPETTQNAGIGSLNVQTRLPNANWRERAEILIRQSGTPSIVIANDPLPNE